MCVKYAKKPKSAHFFRYLQKNYVKPVTDVLHEGQNVLNWESLVLRDSDVIEGSILNGIPTSSQD